MFSPLVRRNSPFPFCVKSPMSVIRSRRSISEHRSNCDDLNPPSARKTVARRMNGEGGGKKDVETNLHSPRKSAKKESRQRRYECVPQAGRRVACSYIILYGWLCRVPFVHSARTSSAQYLAGRLDLHRHKNVSPFPLAVPRHIDITSFAFTFQSYVREFSRPLYV